MLPCTDAAASDALSCWGKHVSIMAPGLSRSQPLLQNPFQLLLSRFLPSYSNNNTSFVALVRLAIYRSQQIHFLCDLIDLYLVFEHSLAKSPHVSFNHSF